MKNALTRNLKELSQDKKVFINIFILFLIFFGLGGIVGILGVNIQKDTIIQNPTVSSFKSIFFNNIRVALSIFFTGFFTVGLLPIVILFINGLNFTSAFVYFSLTEDFAFSLKHVIFHSPFELLGFYFTLVPSIYSYVLFFKSLRENKKFEIRKVIKCSLVCILASTVCLLVAALIEFEVIKFLK
ncbi:stage II sporulation protein M [Bacillus sp. CGMCC 1.60114]|uniref:stage II sporulation protein M n=1 Tax=unclassified Bacillus (in: firmicutes) TaxID=185979 RepID=UPI003630590B